MNTSGELSVLSGDRLLLRSRKTTPGTVNYVWSLRNLRTGQITTLPNALSYNLWGERLARLDADGSAWVSDLRSGAAPVQVPQAPPLRRHCSAASSLPAMLSAGR